MFEPPVLPASDFFLASPKVVNPSEDDFSVFLSLLAPPKLKLGGGFGSDTDGFTEKLNESVVTEVEAVVDGGAPNTKFDGGKDADLAPNVNELLLELVVVVATAAAVELFPNENVELEAVLVVAAVTDDFPNEPKVTAESLESGCCVVAFFVVSADAPKVKAEDKVGLAATESVVVVGAIIF